MTGTIWMYWHQGWEQAPSLVQQCYRSWVRLNPEYQVRTLDQQSLRSLVTFQKGIDFSRRDLTVQKIAALGRLALLAEYGGVWADATVYCARPLREWLDTGSASKFFAFRSPTPDRLMANWFMAADAESLLVQRLYRDFSDFYANNYFFNQDTGLGKRLVEHFVGRWTRDVKSTLKWHSWFARKVLRVYPYFIFHYTFNKIVLTDPECGALWDKSQSLPAGPPHRLQGYSPFPNGLGEARKLIDSQLTPVHKLDWRVDHSSAYWAFVLRYLEEKTCSSSFLPAEASISAISRR